MTILLWITLISALIAGVGAWLFFHYDARWDKQAQRRAHLGLWILIPFGIVLLVSGFVSAIIYPERAVGRTTCRNFAIQSGYQTKFEILNWADGGTCFAKAPDGRWVKNTELYINVPSKP